MTEKLMTPQEVADYLGVPKHTVYQWSSRGTGPRSIRVGRHLRFRPREVERWLDGKTVHPDRQPA